MKNFNLEFQQERWDMKVAAQYYRKTAGYLICQFSETLFDEPGYIWDKVPLLVDAGMKRLPVLAEKDPFGDYARVFMKLPISAWLAVSSPGSVDLFFKKDPLERFELFQQMNVRPYKRIKQRRGYVKPAQRKQDVFISRRSLSKKHDWQKVKA